MIKQNQLKGVRMKSSSRFCWQVRLEPFGSRANEAGNGISINNSAGVGILWLAQFSSPVQCCYWIAWVLHFRYRLWLFACLFHMIDLISGLNARTKGPTWFTQLRMSLMRVIILSPAPWHWLTHWVVVFWVHTHVFFKRLYKWPWIVLKRGRVSTIQVGNVMKKLIMLFNNFIYVINT